jgi:predicted transcriptional regulator
MDAAFLKFRFANLANLDGQDIRMDEKSEIIEMTADIVSAYVGNNMVGAGDLPSLIQSVHRALSGVSTGVEIVEDAPKEPAVPVKRSITPGFLICLEDGRKFKSLKRHLRTKYNMSPEDYRAKWGLAKDYPMVAPDYAKARSELAKQMGLGQGGRQAPRKR